MSGTEKRVVLVTGGARGIGRAISKSFALHGDTVIINYNKSRSEAELLRDELSSANASVFIEPADVSDFQQVKAMVDRILKQHPQIDILVNNAGITRDNYLMWMSEKDWNEVIQTNLTGAFHCCKTVVESMLSRKNGCIINISSISGISGLPGQANYAASKGGLIAFSKALARELARFHIRVNAVVPGVIQTELVDSLPEKNRNEFLQNIPMGRFGNPDEVADLVRFLASPEADYITGQMICVTGGI